MESQQGVFCAVLVLGPTGSGKTALGELLESRGFRGRRCVHFDFGESLRDIANRGRADAIVSSSDVDFLRGVLSSGALLEDKDFPIAQRLLRSFCAQRDVDPQTLVVLNGLPRHVGQANALQAFLRVEAVIELRCSAETVIDRISANTGGDREERTDDQLTDIHRKLAIFAERTAPLVDYYHRAGADIGQIAVSATMTPPQMWDLLERICREA